MVLERLQKVLSNAGIASRRHGEELILAGRVSVNGQVVDRLGSRVDPERDRVAVDGKAISFGERCYLMLNKPRDYVTTLHDPQGRAKVSDLLKGVPRVFPIGRLDRDSEGLLLLTNDGALANLLTHPRYGVDKVYRVLTQGTLSQDALQTLRKGVVLEEGKTGPAKVRVVETVNGGTWLEVTIHQGWKRQLRRMFLTVGYPVERLIRVAVGPLRLEGLPAGKWRPLKNQEVKALQAAAGKKGIKN